MGALQSAADTDWLAEAAAAGRVGLWRLHLNTGDLDSTARCKQILGFAPDAKLHGDDLFAVVHEEDRGPCHAAMKNAVDTRGEYHILCRVRWPDGSMRWIDVRGRPGEDAISGTMIDVTEQREIEERLAREASLIRMITTHVAEPLFFMDAKGSLTFMNPAAERLFGWSLAEIRGRILHEVVHFTRPDGTPFPIEECPLGRTLFGGLPVEGREDVWVHKSGRFVPVLCSATPITEGDEIKGAVVSAHDISERKAAEEALRESSRAKDEFLATVSHELRTPMTAILGWLGYLRMHGVPEELSTVVSHIEASAKAQAAIVEDLVDVSRMVTGMLRLNLGNVDVADLLEDAVRTIRPTAEAKQIVLTATAACDGARVHADRARLRQVLWNLLSNAIKFTPDGGMVTIEARAEHDRIVVTVADTGLGIAPDFLPRVFDRFAQEAGPQRHHGGLGLGLAIVRQLVEMHGGSVAAQSDGPGRGATFTLTLPRAA